MPVGASMYVARDTFIDRTDPRVKLLWMISVNVLVFVFSHPAYEAAIIAYVAAVAIIGRIPARSFRFFGALVALATVSGLVFWPRHVQEGAALFTFLGAEYTSGGVLFGLGMGLRVAGMVSASLIWFMTTPPQLLAESLTRLGLPYKFGMGLSLMIRFIPYISWEMTTITEAQSSRGLDLQVGNLLVRIRKYTAVFSPLFSRMFMLIQTLSVAMDSRGFGYSDRRTSLNELQWSLQDQFATALVISIFGLAVVLRLMGYGTISAGF